MIYCVLAKDHEFEKMCKIQKKDFYNSYFCREIFSHFDSINAPEDAKEEAMKDIISVSDGIVLVGEEDEAMKYILDFADEINMEVEHIENTE